MDGHSTFKPKGVPKNVYSSPIILEREAEAQRSKVGPEITQLTGGRALVSGPGGPHLPVLYSLTTQAALLSAAASTVPPKQGQAKAAA